VRARFPIGRGLVPLLVLLVVAGGVRAEEVEKRFRFGFAAGGFNNSSDVPSDAANTLIVLAPDDSLVDIYNDPRDDGAVFGTLGIEAAPIGTLYGQYAVNRFVVLEASIGYEKHDVGDIEVQAWFNGDTDFPDVQDFNFHTFNLKAGTMEQIPLQFTALVRFRPKANFNPYVGAGVGYNFVGFTPSDELDQLSRNMDLSVGQQERVSSSFTTNPGIAPIGPPMDLTGATVDARDSFEWHLAGGAELTVARKWALFLDVRWTFGSRGLSIGFNGGEDLGIAVPNFTDYEGTELTTQDFGPVLITSGGLIDGGYLGDPFDPSVNCGGAIPPQSCIFIREPDGQLDKGHYYVQGGTIDYGGVGLQFGVRYTF